MRARSTRPVVRNVIVMIVAGCAMLRWLAPMAGLRTPPQILPPQRAHCLRPNTHLVQRAMLTVGDPQLPTPRPTARLLPRRSTSHLTLQPWAIAASRAERRLTPLRI